MSDDAHDAIEAEACAWVLRLAGEVPAETAAACGVWRAADPRHEQAFRDAYRAWTALSRTDAAAGSSWRAEAASLQKRARLRRGAVIGATAAAFAACTAAALLLAGPFAAPPATSTYATRTAQTERLDLADGSRVYVGARSTVKVAVDRTRRRVELADGEAFFEVAHDPAHPFLVQAGDTTIRVLGTKFDVRKVGDDVRVSVLEGRVEVIRKSATAAVARATPTQAVLHPGQQISVGPEVAAAKPVTVSLTLPGAWRQGRLYYADAPLRDVIADANRYSDHPIRLGSQGLGDLRVTAAFRTDRTGDLVADLDKALPIRSEPQADGSVVLYGDMPK